MDEFEKLFKEHLVWDFEKGSVRFFTTKSYDKSMCWLRINDYPDEPLWTLSFNGLEIDFDDEPKVWEINYEQLLEE